MDRREALRFLAAAGTAAALPRLTAGAAILNVTSDAAVEPYEGWGGYGSSKAALEQLTVILAVEHPDLRVYTVDPGDMRTQMHQDAFPGEDISDRPPPEESVPGLLALIEGSLPSGRYRLTDTLRLRPDTVLIGLHPSTTQLDLADSTPGFDGVGSPKAMLMNEFPSGS